MGQARDVGDVIAGVQRRTMTAPFATVLTELLRAVLRHTAADGARIDDPTGNWHTSVGATVPAVHVRSAPIQTLYDQVGTLVAVRTRDVPFDDTAQQRLTMLSEVFAAAFLAVGAATRDDLSSARASALTALHDSSAQLLALFDSTPLGVALVRGEDFALLRTNDAMARLTGLDVATLSRLTLPELFPTTERAAFVQWLRVLSRDSGGASRELRLVRPDGEPGWCRVSAAWVCSAVPVQLVAQVEDITAQWHAQQLLSRLAHTDPLTGLANRLHVERQLESALSRTGNEEVGLLYVDLDGFKDINDQLGHGAGDQLLIQVADRLATSVRPRDIVGRMGGDEFVVVVDHLVDLNELERMTERIRAAVGEVVDLGNGEHVRVSASIGLSTAAPGESPAAVIARADSHMYAEKRRHRERRVAPD